MLTKMLKIRQERALLTMLLIQLNLVPMKMLKFFNLFMLKVLIFKSRTLQVNNPLSMLPNKKMDFY